LIKRLCLAALLAAPAPLAAEIPLQDNASYALQLGDIVVRSDEDAGWTTISKPDDPDFTPWRVPATPRLFALSPKGDAFLAIHDGKHIQQIEMFTFGATAYRRDRDGFTFQHFGLERMIPRNRFVLGEPLGMRWLDSYRTTQQGWDLQLVDGNQITIPFH
jgi:hypothetical protein